MHSYNFYNNYEKLKYPFDRGRASGQDENLIAVSFAEKYSGFVRYKTGNSFTGEQIPVLKIGTGATKVLMWARMHGDEPTAQLSIFDIFYFFASSYDPGFFKYLKSRLTILIVPCLNPDGATAFTRENLQGIDINRDSIELQTPEAKFLTQLYNEFKPHFCFNLHDQDRCHAAGDTGLSALISFMAPPVDEQNNVPVNRLLAKKVISSVIPVISEFIPGHIAKYPEDFESSAFGDRFQLMGSSTILVECGGWSDDIERSFARKICFITILELLDSIASKKYENYDETVYNSLIVNVKNLADIRLRGVKNEEGLTSDFFIKVKENLDSQKRAFNFEYEFVQEYNRAYFEFNLENYTVNLETVGEIKLVPHSQELPEYYLSVKNPFKLSLFEEQSSIVKF
ncbi:MAG: DUF2817 domain-containing protein [Ignavibacteriaceae bacterium]|nr:DUF2817 domain-containing protein [Ignavibacteriaceae bacterium]